MSRHCRDPQHCTVCRQAAGEVIHVRRVAYDDTDQMLKVDGVPVRSTSMPEPRPLLTPTYSGHQLRRCGRCGQVGHNQKHCGTSVEDDN